MNMKTPPRAFEDKPAVRERVPLLVGLMGPSGGGKTYSALRLSVGIQRVTGGDIYMIDTEAKRGLHYADKFRFRHVPFAPPFSPLDYLAALDYAVKKGAGVIIVDSMSHEHEGPGGLLEWHQANVDRMSGGDDRKAERVKMLAWSEPKQARRRLINGILQYPCNFVFCFRAKEKLKIARGKEPEKMGFMPIAGEEFVYEMTTSCLLMPAAGGVPTWHSEEIGERMMIKLPEQFKAIFAGEDGCGPLDEAAGEAMAKWAAGAASSEAFTRMRAGIMSAKSRDDLRPFGVELRRIAKEKDAKAMPPTEYRSLVDLLKDRDASIGAAGTTPSLDDTASDNASPPREPGEGE